MRISCWTSWERAWDSLRCADCHFDHSFRALESGFLLRPKILLGCGFLLGLVAGDGFISLLFSNIFNGLLTVARFQAVAQLVVVGVDAHDAQDFILFGLGLDTVFD